MGEEDRSIIRLEKVIADLDATTNEYFLNVIKSKGFDLGILRLRKGETDTQEPHSVDEVYFVIEGNGHIEIEDKMKPANRVDFIFAPVSVHHRFVVANKDLMVILFFWLLLTLENIKFTFFYIHALMKVISSVLTDTNFIV